MSPKSGAAIGAIVCDAIPREPDAFATCVGVGGQLSRKATGNLLGRQPRYNPGASLLAPEKC